MPDSVLDSNANCLLQVCTGDEVKKDSSALDDIQATIEARLKEVKDYFNEHVDQEKVKEFVEKFGENAKKFLTDTQKDAEKLTEKKA